MVLDITALNFLEPAESRLSPNAYDSQRALEVESLTLGELVCFENTDFCVVDKPYDLQIDGARPATLEALLKKLHPEFRELKFCHQLDYATSGLLLLAKSRSAAAAARDAFDARLVVKRYEPSLKVYSMVPRSYANRSLNARMEVLRYRPKASRLRLNLSCAKLVVLWGNLPVNS